MNLRRIQIFILGAFLLSTTPPGRATAADGATTPDWQDQTVDSFGSIPIQEDGRAKPLSTYAGFLLLRLNGKRTFTAPDGDRLSATAWMLDCIFRPEQARAYKCFRVENSDVLQTLGLPYEKRRDRYSFNDLMPAMRQLNELSSQYWKISKPDRTPVQQQVLNLRMNVIDFSMLTQSLAMFQPVQAVAPGSMASRVFPDRALISVYDVYAEADAITRALQMLQVDEPPNLPEGLSVEQARRELQRLLLALRRTGGPAGPLTILAPPAEDGMESVWLSPAGVLEAGARSPELAAALAPAMSALLRCTAATAGSADMAQAAHDLQTELLRAAGTQVDPGRIALEVTYYRGKFFYYSLLLYLVAFLIVAASWLRTGGRWSARLTFSAVTLPTILLWIGIAMRCVIRGRPPVTNLYETLLFVTAVAVTVALFVEFANPRRVALGVGCFTGLLGVFIANKFELKDGVDTMESMIAVLDSNFWLATHVTAITIGYAAGILAGMIAHAYIFGRLFSLSRDRELFRNIARMVYGVLCFGLFFAFIGTVLGGIWANDSWGRFWGWDPKENGALMIVLWQLAILHARLGNYISDLGVCMTAVIGSIIVSMSWWGVNLLGVGLHSYGFTSGIMTSLLIFWSIETFVFAMGIVIWQRERIAAHAEDGDDDEADEAHGAQPA